MAGLVHLLLCALNIALYACNLICTSVGELNSIYKCGHLTVRHATTVMYLLCDSGTGTLAPVEARSLHQQAWAFELQARLKLSFLAALAGLATDFNVSGGQQAMTYRAVSEADISAPYHIGMSIQPLWLFAPWSWLNWTASNLPDQHGFP